MDWGDVGLTALSSVSVGGRLGYKALEALGPYARTLSKRGAYGLRAQVRRQFRLFGKVDDFLRKRDKTFEQVRDPHESFTKSHPGWDLGIAGSGALSVGAQVGIPSNSDCGCK